jgi:MFS family permease
MMLTRGTAGIAGAEHRYRTLLLVALGGVLENYDFIIFALFARVLGQLFFPPGMPEWIALLQTFGIFAAGNLARPIGGVAMAHYGDLLGRKRTFVLSVVLMAIATLGVACAPTYGSIGSGAPIILLLFRILQGFAMGGELPGAWIFVAEQVGKHRVGLACGVLLSALSAGNLVGAVVGILVNRLYQPAEVLAFAWRIPFLAGGILAVASVYLRRWLDETPIFTELKMQGRLAAELPLKIVLRDHGRSVLISMGLTVLFAVTIVVVFVFTPTLLQTSYGISPERSYQAVSFATASLSISCIICGLLADAMGSRRFLMLGTPVLAGCIYLFYSLLPGHLDWLFPLYSLAGASVGVIGAIPSVFVRSFPPAVRFSGVAFSYNVAFAIFSGLTPLLITLFLRIDPLAHAHALLICCVAACVWLCSSRSRVADVE